MSDVKQHPSSQSNCDEPDVDEVLAIRDPSERNKENHLWGDRFMLNVGNIAAWIFPILMIAIVSQVFLRKVGLNQAWLDDAQWWMYGVAVLAGMGYAVTTNSHVRVDIFHAHFSDSKKAKIEIFGVGWLFLPFLLLMTDIMVHYTYASWQALEGSDSPNGLHGLYILKTFMPFLFFAAIIASFAVISRHLAVLCRPTLLTTIMAAFPAIWFIAERFSYYSLWWVVHLSKPDLHVRRVGRDPLMQDTLWYGLAIIITLAVISFLLNRKHTQKG